VVKLIRKECEGKLNNIPSPVCFKKLEKSPPSPIAPIGRHSIPDVELATLRESPRGRSGQPVMQLTNAMYIAASSENELHDSTEENLLSSADMEIAALPQIRRYVCIIVAKSMK
jgi:hypothetical protein